MDRSGPKHRLVSIIEHGARRRKANSKSLWSVGNETILCIGELTTGRLKMYLRAAPLFHLLRFLKQLKLWWKFQRKIWAKPWIFCIRDVEQLFALREKGGQRSHLFPDMTNGITP